MLSPIYSFHADFFISPSFQNLFTIFSIYYSLNPFVSGAVFLSLLSSLIYLPALSIYLTTRSSVLLSLPLSLPGYLQTCPPISVTPFLLLLPPFLASYVVSNISLSLPFTLPTYLSHPIPPPYSSLSPLLLGDLHNCFLHSLFIHSFPPPLGILRALWKSTLRTLR